MTLIDPIQIPVEVLMSSPKAPSPVVFGEASASGEVTYVLLDTEGKDHARFDWSFDGAGALLYLAAETPEDGVASFAVFSVDNSSDFIEFHASPGRELPRQLQAACERSGTSGDVTVRGFAW